MGSYYFLNDKKCPYCHKAIGGLTYATCYEDYNMDGEWIGNKSTCPYCKKEFKMEMKFLLQEIK